MAQRGALTPGGFIVDASNGSPQPQQQQRTKPPRIIYASRTHTQVAQVIAELRSMTMSPSAVTLAARQHYCIHKTASQARDVNHECLRLLSDESPATCFHYRQAEGLAQHLRGEVLDIEDLVTEGRQHGGCPYFAAKELSATADITLCPYNYVMCPEVRKAMGLEVEGAVVIIDEAHNIEHVAMDAGSFSASITALEIATKVPDRGWHACSVQCPQPERVRFLFRLWAQRVLTSALGRRCSMTRRPMRTLLRLGRYPRRLPSWCGTSRRLWHL